MADNPYCISLFGWERNVKISSLKFIVAAPVILSLIRKSINQTINLVLQKLFEGRKWSEGNDKQKHGLQSEFCIYGAIH